MKIGIIGAGKVGCSIGKYLTEHGFSVAGYCSKSKKAWKRPRLLQIQKHMILWYRTSGREHDSFSYHAGWCVGKCVERTEKRINTK